MRKKSLKVGIGRKISEKLGDSGNADLRIIICVSVAEPKYNNAGRLI